MKGRITLSIGRFVARALARRWWALPAAVVPLLVAAFLLVPRDVPVTWTAEARAALVPSDPALGLPDPNLVWNAPETARRAGQRLAEGLQRPAAEAEALGAAVASSVRVELRQDHVRISAVAAQDVVAGTHALVYAEAGAAEALARQEAAIESRLRDLSRKEAEARQKADLIEPETRVDLGRSRDNERRLAALNAAAMEIERQIEGVRAREDKTLARIRSLEADEHRLRELLPSGPEEDGLKSPVLDRIRNEMAGLRTEMALKGWDRAGEHPEAIQRKARLAELDQAFRSELHRVRSSTIVALRESLAELDSELRTLDERRLRKSLEIRDLSDELRAAEERRAEQAAHRKEADVLAAERARLASARAGVPVGPARLLSDPVPSGGRGGRAAALLWAGLAGLFIGLSTAMLLESLDSRIRSARDVRRLLGLPCLAVLERAKSPLILGAPAGSMTESYGMAATMVRTYLADKGFKAVLVGSAGPGEGKSVAAANLAVALARKGLRTVLVDADLRRPRQHELFQLDNSQGLATYLVGTDLDPDLPGLATELPTLRVLPSGPVDQVAPEYVESARLADLIRQLRERHDVVVIDGPPLTGASEALALAKVADTVLWAVRAGRADAGRQSWARQLLSNLNADLAGAVVTMADGSDVRRYAPA